MNDLVEPSTRIQLRHTDWRPPLGAVHIGDSDTPVLAVTHAGERLRRILMPFFVNGLQEPIPAPVYVNDRQELILVSLEAGELLSGYGRTDFWRLRKRGIVETVKLGSRDLVVFRSLEKLAETKAA